jgi:hypothetical protein
MSVRKWRESLAEGIRSTRQKGGKKFEVQKRVSDLLVKELQAHGKCYRDGPHAFYHDHETGETIEIDGGDRYQLLLSTFDVYPADEMYAYVTSALYFHARKQGHKRTYTCCRISTRRRTRYT